MQQNKFFTNTIENRFIKNLMINTALPIYNSVSDGDYLIKDNYYVYGTNLIRCISSGYMTKEGIAPDNDDNVGASNDITSVVPAGVKVIDNTFFVGRYYPKKTFLYDSSFYFYDTDTHVWLGNYLRYYRDVFKTNLMPFYNCFNGKYSTKFLIKNNVKDNNSEDNSISIEELKYDYYKAGNKSFNDRYYNNFSFKVAQVPIKFNKQYTIAIETTSPIYIYPCFISDNRLLSVEYGGSKINLTKLLNSIIKFDYIIDSCSYKYPLIRIVENNNQSLLRDEEESIIFEPNNPNLNITLEQLFQRYEKYLYLLIQIPISNESSISILEGNYVDVRVDKYFNIENLENISEKELDHLCLSELSLLKLNDKTRHTYASRLIEYLLWNVVDNNEELGNNVTYVQDFIGLDYSSFNHLKGYYDSTLRSLVFNTYRKSKKVLKLDNNGYLDKNVEKYLNDFTGG